MIKKITTLVSTNKKAILRKSLIWGGLATGLIAGALLVKPDEDIIISEVVEGEFTISERTPEQN